MELGERVRDAVIREAKEECGLDTELVIDMPMDETDNLIVDENGRLQYHYILLQFLARPNGGTIKPASDVLDARWVPLDEVEKYDLTRSFRSFFKKHQDVLKGI